MDKKRREGYIVHSLILCLWKEDEDISDEYLPLLYQKPELMNQIIMVGENTRNTLDEIFKEEFSKIQQPND